MSTVTATDVKKLRDMTNLPMMECKNALVESGGDIDKAVQYLREHNAKVVIKREGRETAEGRIGVFVDNDKGVAGIVELRCESPPVVKSEDFIKLATDIAKQVACNESADVESLLQQTFVDSDSQTVKDRIDETIGLIRENMQVQRYERLQDGPFGCYVHFDGSVGVLFQAEGETPSDPQVLKDVCMHITASNPYGTRAEDVDAKVIEEERNIALKQAKEEGQGKPDNIIEKIAEGKVNKWLKQNVLVDQPFVKDPSKTVGELLKEHGLTAKKFIRFKVGGTAS